MKQIIVPTDFSESAEHATSYAIEVARKLGARIVFYHTYNFPDADPMKPVYSRSGNLIQPSALADEYKVAIDQKLKGMCEEIQLQTDRTVLCDFFSTAGLTIDQALESMEVLKSTMVVMGTKGYSDRDEIFIGSNAARMVERSPIPVMVIPQGARYKPINRIVFASGLLEKDISPLMSILPLVKAYEAHIAFVHLDPDPDEDEEAALDGYREIVQDHIDHERMSFHLLKEKSVIDGLEHAAVELNADMLVMHTLRRTGWLTNLFHKSLSKEMVFHTKVPLLVLHS
jgi:nucleotide-binding universal stress UspA family protein